MIPLQTPSYTKLYNCLGINLNCAEKLTRCISHKPSQNANEKCEIKLPLTTTTIRSVVV